MRFLSLIGAASLAWAAMATNAAAQTSSYPKNFVRIVVGSSPGGTADTISRMVAEALTTKLGKPFIVENQPGAGGALAAKSVKAASPDGYTIQFIFSSFSILPSLNPKVGYDPVADFAPIAQVSAVPNLLLVHPSFGVSSLREWIAKVKQNPGKFDYGSGGIGYSQHLSMEMLLQGTNGEMVHIPYTGSGSLLGALLPGQVPTAFEPLTTAVPHVQSGALIPLAITSAGRSSLMPNVPAISEEIPGYELTAWNGFVAPAGTPPEIISILNKAITEYLATDKSKALFDKLATEISPSTPEEFGKIIANDYRKFADVITAAGIKAR